MRSRTICIIGGLLVCLLAGQALVAEPTAKDRTLIDWVADLAAKDVKTRRVAAYELVGLGREAAPYARRIAGCLLTEPDEQTAEYLAEVFYRMAPAGADAVEELAKCLKIKHARGHRTGARITVVLALARYGAAAHETLPALKEAAETPGQETWARRLSPASYAKIALAAGDPSGLDYLVEEGAISETGVVLLIARFGEKAISAIPKLVAQYPNLGNSRLKAEYLIAFGMFGPAAKDALPTLRQALTDTSPLVRAAAKVAIRKIEIPAGTE